MPQLEKMATLLQLLLLQAWMTHLVAVINDRAKACSPIAASCSVALAYMCGGSDLISSSDLRARVMTQALYT